jgi:four helix bundle protein
MGTVKTFEQLEVWQEGRGLVTAIYRVTGKGHFLRDFGLRDQLRRAAVSIPSNIAEGFERSGTRELIHFLYLAKGSAGEIRTQLYLALDLNYLEIGDFEILNTQALTVSRKLSAFIKYLHGIPVKPRSRPQL